MIKPLSKFTAIAAILLISTISCTPHAEKKEQNSSASVLNDSTAKIIVVDVRTPEEYAGDGHAACTVNYPLDQFSQHIDELKSYDKVYLVCLSGGRAGVALDMLNEAGYTKGENAGSWQDAPCSTK